MVSSGFLDPQRPRRLLPKLRRLFGRAELERDEINILRGLLDAVEKQVAGRGRQARALRAIVDHNSRYCRITPGTQALSLKDFPLMFSHLREDIQSVFDRDPAARTFWEVLTCYPGVHAMVSHRLAHWLWVHRLRWLGRLVSHLGRFLYRHRNPSRSNRWAPPVHRSRDGCGDRRDGGDRR
jgi:hypothetical protein